ncbi:MAG: membrane-binding protein [Flavobacteriaceae bacterium]|nr:membrane-binding protein [Flavobacteriaceae bacterium]
MLVEGLKGRQARELPAGVVAQQITEIEQLHQKAESLNTQQEKLKADLKVKTAELDATVKEMETKVAVVRKYVKLGTQKEEWREFGIEDKR